MLLGSAVALLAACSTSDETSNTDDTGQAGASSGGASSGGKSGAGGKKSGSGGDGLAGSGQGGAGQGVQNFTVPPGGGDVDVPLPSGNTLAFTFPPSAAGRDITFTVGSSDDLGWEPGFMHNVHLIFHEAGHAIFMMVGAPRTLVVFMGSGLQVLFPLGIAAAFYFKNRDAYGAAVCLWWAGHATLDVAPYIADARALELPLLGGGNGREIEGHDWEYLLGHWNALHLDTRIGATVAFAGRAAINCSACASSTEKSISSRVTTGRSRTSSGISTKLIPPPQEIGARK